MITHFQSERMLQLKGAYDHYDLITAVTLKHVPVISGIVAATLVFLSPYVYTMYQRKYGSKTIAPAPHPSASVTAKAQEKKRKVEAWRANERSKLDALTKALASDPSLESASELMGTIDDEPIRAEGAVAIGLWRQEQGDTDSAASFFREALSLGKNSRKGRGAAEGAHHLSRIAEMEGDTAQALEYARKVLFIAEKTGLSDMVAETEMRIKKIKEQQ